MREASGAKVEQHTERRILVAAMRQVVTDRTRDTSPRWLLRRMPTATVPTATVPTDHDHVGGPLGSIHEYQNDLPSFAAGSAFSRLALSRLRTLGP